MLSERFGELWAKGWNDSLTVEEWEELGRFRASCAMEPAPMTDFVSKFHFQPTDLTARLAAIDWFAHCGQPFDGKLTMPVKQVTNWPEAALHSLSIKWEYITLSTSTQLTRWVFANTREHRPRRSVHDAAWIKMFGRLYGEVWRPYFNQHPLDSLQRPHLLNKIIEDLRRSICGAIQENNYLDLGHGSYFYLELLTVYEAGHFPCGWRGDWPNGELLVL